METRIPIGLELFSVRNELAEDVRGTIKAVAEMGYEGVEFAGPPQHPAEELKGYLDEFGLVCCGWHTPFNLVQEDTLNATIEFNKVLENPYIIVPGIPGELRQSRADWLKLADIFNGIADKLATHGMVTGYHNHHAEILAYGWRNSVGHLLREYQRRGRDAAGYGECTLWRCRSRGYFGEIPRPRWHRPSQTLRRINRRDRQTRRFPAYHW